MKTNGEDTAFPMSVGVDPTIVFAGMTKREYFAAMAMQGFCSQPEYCELHSAESISTWAVDQADALIAALNKEGGANG